jgi:hypothetical protein
MEKGEIANRLQDMIDRHKSLFLLGKAHIEDLQGSNLFSEDEKMRIREYLELVVGDIIEHRSLLSEILQYVAEADENHRF